jgi:hypothetical protein
MSTSSITTLPSEILKKVFLFDSPLIHHSVQNLVSPSLPCKNLKIEMYKFMFYVLRYTDEKLSLLP